MKPAISILLKELVSNFDRAANGYRSSFIDALNGETWRLWRKPQELWIFKYLRNNVPEDEWDDLWCEYKNIRDATRTFNALMESGNIEEVKDFYERNGNLLPEFDFENFKKKQVQKGLRMDLLSRLKIKLEEGDFATPDSLFYNNGGLLSVNEYEEIKSSYIKTFFKKNFNKVELSDEQLLAVADVSQNLLLRARAGSGKTTTLSSKIGYLIMGGKIDQRKIVALCFNKEASKNIIKKLGNEFGIKCHEKENITTFHSLAFQISPPEEGVETLFDDLNPQSEQMLTAFVEKILLKKWDDPFTDLRNEDILHNKNSIFGFIKDIYTNSKYAKFKTAVYAIAREDRYFDIDEEMSQLEKEGIQFGSKDHYLYRRNLSYITLDGKHVKSFGEKCIADYFFEHGIKYKYEPNFRMGNHTYHPDFELYDNKIIIEHWGIDEFDKQKKVPKNWLKTWDEYKGEMDRKRLYWEDYNKNGKAYNFLETNVTQLKNGREEFERIIAKKLQDQGVNNSRLPVDEIINNLSHNLRRRFSAKIVSYIQKAKQNEKSPEEMKLKIDEAKYYKYSKENIFLNLANIIYTQYEINKKEEKKIDFYDFLSSAVKRINETNGNCKLRSGVGIKEIDWLLIDEFQDFSPLFLALVKAIKKYNSDLKIFCVGDDWQAINSFAGSDVELFNKFEEEFPGNTAIKNLTINWRSNSDIINLGNRIMTDHGVESRPNSENREHGIIECSNINQDTQGQFDISDAKVKFDFNTNADVALLRYLYRTADIIDKHLKYLKDNNEFKVLILSRKLKILQKCDLDDFTKRIEKYFINKYPEDKDKIAAIFNKQIDKNGNEYKQVESKTAHQSKGLEANIVVVLEATNRCFPLIHPDSLLFEIFGVNLDEIIDEERRLFYVACSRAKSDLYLLYEEDLDKKKTLTEFYLNRYA